MHFTALRYRTTSLYLGRRTEGEEGGKEVQNCAQGKQWKKQTRGDSHTGDIAQQDRNTAGNKFREVIPRLSQLWQNKTRGCLAAEFLKWTGFFAILGFLEDSPLKTQNTLLAAFHLSASDEEELLGKSTCKTCRVYGDTEMSHSSNLPLVLRHSKGFE